MRLLLVIGCIVAFILWRVVSCRSVSRYAIGGAKIENIRAEVMLASNNSKEIEKFLMHKEPYITDELIGRLIARIQELKADEVIEADWKKKSGIIQA